MMAIDLGDARALILERTTNNLPAVAFLPYAIGYRHLHIREKHFVVQMRKVIAGKALRAALLGYAA